MFENRLLDHRAGRYHPDVVTQVSPRAASAADAATASRLLGEEPVDGRSGAGHVRPEGALVDELAG